MERHQAGVTQPAGLLVRVSSLDAAEAGSTQTQIDYLLRWCAKESYTVNPDHIYVDEGVSGAVPIKDWGKKRPEAARMLRDARRGSFAVLVTYKVDRLARSARTIYEAVDTLTACGVHYRSATQPIDTNGPFGRAMLGVLAVFAELERDMITERSHEGRCHTARAGRWAGGMPALGYKTEKRGTETYLVKDSERAAGLEHSEEEIAAMIWNTFVDEELSLSRLKKVMDESGIPNTHWINYPRHKTNIKQPATEWTVDTLHTILRNPVYKGLLQYGKQKSGKAKIEVEAPELAIVDEATWNKAQQILKENRTLSPRNSRRIYPLKGKIICGVCGSKFCGWSRGESHKYARYSCHQRTAALRLKVTPCPAPHLHAEEVEEQVWEDLLWATDHVDEVRARLLQQLEARAANHDDIQREADSLTGTLKRLEEAKGRVAKLYVRGQFTEGQKDRELAELESEAQAALARKVDLDFLLSDTQTLRKAVSQTAQILENVRRAMAEDWNDYKRYRLIQKAVRQIRVVPTGEGWNLEVDYAFGHIESAAICGHPGNMTDSPATLTLTRRL